VNGNTGSRELKSEGNAVQSPANLTHDRCLCIRKLQRLTTICDVLDEQLHGRVAERLRRGKRSCALWGTCERLEVMHVLAFGAQSFATSGEDVHLGSIAEDTFDQSRSALDDVLATVEDEEHSLLAQRREYERKLLGCDRHETQLRRKDARKQLRIIDGRKVEEVNGSLEFGNQAVSQCQSDGCFAYPTCTDDRYETLLFYLSG
jgi:hypothetical protein